MWESSGAGLEHPVPQKPWLFTSCRGRSPSASLAVILRASVKQAVVSTLLAAWCLLGLTVTIHAAGLSAMLPRACISRLCPTGGSGL